ncbi:MAG TPA: PBP1A family penicillin-binding protein [Caulobacteraceae bacterium]|nr:PBP1A family penicillin-binding protein [Caulobacteraceae bacterium]
MLAVASLLTSGPQLPPLPPIKREPQITYVDRAGATLGVRGGRFGPPVDVAKLPPYVPAAFVAIEDRRFYSHEGFDALGIARAIVSDLEQGKATQGASTITQQLARNLFLSSDRTMERKALELVYAIELEQAYSKPQILGLYLSRVYFGSGAYGIEAAARRYYNTSAERLTIREAASLAAVMKSPTEYDPAEQPDRSAERTRLVLDAMMETGAISPAQHAQALAHAPKVWKQAPTEAAQYFVDWIDGQTRRMVNASALSRDLVVETTLDEGAEAEAQSATATTLARYKSRGVAQAALVAMDGLGRVRAMIGGADYQQGPFDRAVEAHRQAGSSWKPFVYLTALEAGRTPDSPVVDEPVTINGWTPVNYEPEYLGPITLETALAHSINTVAARLADEVGRPVVAATARRVGIVSPVNTDPAMALGTTLVTPLEMAQAYDTFSNGGYRVAAYGVQRIRLAGGPVIYQHPQPTATSVIANPPLGYLDQMLRAVIGSGTGVRAAIPGYDLAGKTGTTSDYKDAWFCGFTGGLTTVVWVGRDDATPMARITGATAPVDLWRGFMTAALKRLPYQAIPPGPPPPAPIAPAPVTPDLAPPPPTLATPTPTAPP